MGFTTVEEYLATFDEPTRTVLDEVRRTVRKVLPEAEERIAYQIPTYTVAKKNVVHFAGYRQHVSVYPIPAGDEEFQAAIAPFVAGKGTARFPLADPVPYPLIARMTELLAAERGIPRPA